MDGGKPVPMFLVGRVCVCVRQSDAASITVAPEGGVTDEGDTISAETAERGATQRGATQRAAREEDDQPGPRREMT